MTMEGNLERKSSYQGHMFPMAGSKKSSPYIFKRSCIYVRYVLCMIELYKPTVIYSFTVYFYNTVMAQHVFSMVGINWNMPATTVELLECWNNSDGNVRQKSWWSPVTAYIWWIVFQKRNNRNFEHKHKPFWKLDNCVYLFQFWCKERRVENTIENTIDMLGLWQSVKQVGTALLWL